MSKEEKKQPQATGRIVPTWPAEAELFYAMRNSNVVDIVQDLCAQFYQQYNATPDLIFLSTAITRQVEQAVYARSAQVGFDCEPFCIPKRDIIWFYCSPAHARLLFDAEYMLVTHSKMQGAICSL